MLSEKFILRAGGGSLSYCKSTISSNWIFYDFSQLEMFISKEKLYIRDQFFKLYQITYKSKKILLEFWIVDFSPLTR
jgi:hypothetical protein